MNTMQLECFLAVAEHLNFAKAAEKVCISQPSVTHQIHSLETELGTKLFHRSTRSVELTESGLVFLDDAKNILALSRRAKKRFADPAGADMLPLHIGYSGLTQMILFPDILSRLIRIFPNLHPSFHQMPRAQIFARIEEGDIDIALGIREEQPKKGGPAYLELGRTQVCCVCRPEHPLALLPSASMGDIRPHRLILYRPEATDSETAALQHELMAEKPLSDLYFCEFAEDAMVLVEAGLGVSVLPEILTASRQELVVVPIRDVKELSFGLYYKKGHGNKVVKEFIRAAKDVKW